MVNVGKYTMDIHASSGLWYLASNEMGNEEFKMNLLVESTDWQLPCRKKTGGVEGLAFRSFLGARNGKFSEVIRISFFFLGIGI